MCPCVTLGIVVAVVHLVVSTYLQVCAELRQGKNDCPCLGPDPGDEEEWGTEWE